MESGRDLAALGALLAEFERPAKPKAVPAKAAAKAATISFGERIDEIDRLMGEGAWAVAEQKAQDCAERYFDSAVAWQRLGRCRLQLRRYAQAQQALEKALACDPKSAPAKIELASLYVETHRFEAALSLLDRLEAELGRSAPAAAPVRRAAEQGLGQDSLETRLAGYVHAFEAATAAGDWAGAVSIQRTLQDRAGGLREAPWNQNPMLARAAYMAFNPATEAVARGYEPSWIDAAVEFDFVSWPRRVHRWVEGRDVADVGCGHGAYSVGFVIAGARSYTGIDPVIDMDSIKARNKRIRKNAPFPCTPRQIQARLDQVEIVPGMFERFRGVKTFDTIVMHNVSEHLMQIEQVFEGLTHIMGPESLLIFHHHNFYCWNGHHLPPNTVAQLDENNPEQAKYYDWRHIRFEPGPNHYIATNLNRIRLDDLRALCDRHFEVQIWDERNSSPDILARLTPEIRAELAEYSERELSVNGVFVVCRLRS